jgi:hypothetical protein
LGRKKAYMKVRTLEEKLLLRPEIGKKICLYKSPGLEEKGLESPELWKKKVLPTLSYDCRKMMEALGVRFFIGPRSSPPPSPRLHKNGWLGVGRGREELIPPMSDV